MELRTRHDLISSVYTAIVPGGWMDTISFEVWMNDDAMDHVILGWRGRKLLGWCRRSARICRGMRMLFLGHPRG
ncbi:hypothetical protein QJS04_geneDACA023774 [Acorus gramineus]|nr:hypothetical protein QJS04_geneDACA018038 [Acorus gramineus]KAK1260439.1 hypothetical protein QJS04_geneDACA018037 [Acorus gramineus]KAK1277200.1 hypothetical protein QJS04_geneDACA023774 [Acorus gramineus]